MEDIMSKVDYTDLDFVDNSPTKETRREVKIRNHRMDDRGNKSYSQKTSRRVNKNRWED